jgi:hypothetical protein
MAKKTTESDLRLQEEYIKAIKESNLSAKERIDLINEISKMERRQVKLALEELATLKKITAEEKKKEDNLKRIQKLKDDAIKKEKELVDQNNKLIDIASDLQNVLQGNITKYKGIGKETSSIVQDLNKKIIAEVKSGKMGAHQAKVLMAQNAEASKLARAVDTIASNEKMAHIFDETMTQIDTLTDKIEGAFNNIPGGGALFKIIGGDKLNAQLKEGAVNGMAAMTKAMQAGQSPLAALNAGMKAFNATVAAAIVAAIVVLKKLVALAGEHEKKARELAEAQGITVSQGKEMLKDAQDAASAFGTQLVNAKEVLSVQSELADQLGNSSMISADVAANVAETGKAFGYGVRAAGELQATFQSIGLSAQEAAEFQAELAQESLAAGVNTGKVVNDIAKNAKATTKFFGGNVKALKQAAIEANKLGMSISDMAKVSDGLLQFEESIAKQFEFQALSGKEINLDLARQKALQGDIAGATKEVLKQVGGIDEFNSMGVLQRQALADAAGMEVEQLQKTLAIQKAMPNATAEQLKIMEKLGLTAEEIQKMNPEDLKNRLAQEQAAEKMNTEMANMKAQLMQALLPLGEAFMKIFQVLSPILKVISFIFKGIGFAIELFLSPLEAVYSIFRSIEKAVGNIFGGFMDILSGDFESGFKKIGQGILGIILMPFQAIVDLAVGFINLLIDGVNMIPGVDLDYLPSPNLAGLVGGLVGLEQGGTVTKGGAFMVGESGPEVVNLSPGDAVTPNNQITGNGGGGSNKELLSVMRQMLIALQNPVPVQVGSNAIREIGAQIDIQRSYTSRG